MLFADVMAVLGLMPIPAVGRIGVVAFYFLLGLVDSPRPVPIQTGKASPLVQRAYISHATLLLPGFQHAVTRTAYFISPIFVYRESKKAVFFSLF
jgi:hypothetical protein